MEKKPPAGRAGKTGKPAWQVGRYLKYAIGEIVLVVIGILIALQINNWNETRKDHIAESNILQDIQGSISTDIQQLNLRIELAKNDVQSANIILKHLEKNLPYNDSLNKHFVIITSTAGKAFTPQISAYKVLESKGIDLISNNQLKKDILNLYNIDYNMLVYEYENFHKNIHDYGRPIARSLFNTTSNNSDQLPELQPVDYKSLRSNVELINTLKIIISNDRRIHEMLIDLIDKCQEIQNVIDAELKK
ncbi:DUF6090 family protein [Namhaeicola litoreus]